MKRYRTLIKELLIDLRYHQAYLRLELRGVEKRKQAAKRIGAKMRDIQKKHQEEKK